MRRAMAVAVLAVCLGGGLQAQSVCGDCLRADLEFLAADALRGRKGGSNDELVAAQYVAAAMRRNHIEPAGSNGYLQPLSILTRKASGQPMLTFTASDGRVLAQFTHGSEMLVMWASDAEIAAPLRVYDGNAAPAPPTAGSILLLTPSTKPGAVSEFTQALDFVLSGMAAVMLRADADLKRDWAQISGAPGVATQIEGLAHTGSVLVLNDAAWEQVAHMPAGTTATLRVTMTGPQRTTTWNVVGKLPGSAPNAGVIVLGAHLDHIGVGTGEGDQIYNGADDNASGVAMVLELMRELARGPRLRRTVVFAFFGSEERGGLGAAYFRASPPQRDITTVLNFDMVSRPGEAGFGKLILTGSDRSTLAAALMQHGTAVRGDTEKTKPLFERSDAYILTRNGMVAHTFMSSGVHADYHQPSDDVSHVDFGHMQAATRGVLPAIRWLANSDFHPQWRTGLAPAVLAPAKQVGERASAVGARP